MADTKISAFSAAATLGGTELLAGVQSGGNVKVTPNQIKAFIIPGWFSFDSSLPHSIDMISASPDTTDAGVIFSLTAVNSTVRGTCYMYASNGYSSFTVEARDTAGAMTAKGILRASGDKVKLKTETGTFMLEGMMFTGSSGATFSASNAPATLVVRKWIKVCDDSGTVGYVPWFSV